MQQDVSDGQAGIAFTLDIGIMDTTSCQPLSGVLVELWSSNATGQYGSFLRGATTTASNGIAEFQTIFPGYASDGANHFSIAVHATSSMSSPVIHTGQLFFTDRWTDVVSMTADYQGNTNQRMVNSQDPNFAAANGGGYSAIVNVLSIYDDWPEGIIGDITVGVNPSSAA
ncbi:aromatic compound dioxygenase [Hymenopellis radicata]|nr:aromatic compound dioxygenase [Hymenopellis radicata]